MAPRVVIITEATSGIGRATALAFAEQGDALILSGRDPERGAAVVAGCRELGADVLFVMTDPREPEAPKWLVDAALNRHGQLDVAFNNATSHAPRALLHKQDDATYEAVFEMNVASVFRAMRAQLNAMLPRRTGVIINTATATGAKLLVPGLALYAASKAALVSLTRSAAIEAMPYGVRINSVSPGRVRNFPAQRAGGPEDVARAVVWLASDDAAFVVGHDFRVDGGFLAA